MAYLTSSHISKHLPTYAMFKLLVCVAAGPTNRIPENENVKRCETPKVKVLSWVELRWVNYLNNFKILIYCDRFWSVLIRSVLIRTEQWQNHSEESRNAHAVLSSNLLELPLPFLDSGAQDTIDNSIQVSNALLTVSIAPSFAPPVVELAVDRTPRVRRMQTNANKWLTF
jgi:hypothetical protein